MADKEINDLTDGGAAASGDLAHVVRSGNSRKVALGDAAGKSVGTGSGSVAAGDDPRVAAALQMGMPVNLAFAASVAGNALTIAIKGHDGNDPSSTNPVRIPFRSPTAGSGDVDVLTLTAATSLAISSGSTMGFSSGVAGRLWIVGFNDGGTFRLGAVNCLSGVNIMPLRDGIYSSTAEGGAGGADSAQTIYTGTAVTSKAMVILGYLEATEATAGTWATAPSLVKTLSLGDKLPGDMVQRVRTDTAAFATGSTTIPLDDTIPQITEGNEYMTQAITPTASPNLLEVRAGALFANSVATSQVAYGFWRDSTANALAVANNILDTATGMNFVTLSKLVLAASTSSTTFRFRAGGNAGTVTFNGQSGARLYGGVAGSYMEILEIMA